MDPVYYELVTPTPLDEVREHYRRQWYFFRRLDKLEAEVRHMRVQLAEKPRTSLATVAE